MQEPLCNAPRRAVPKGRGCVLSLCCLLPFCQAYLLFPPLQGGLSPTSSVLVGQLSLAEAPLLAGTLPSAATGARSPQGRQAAVHAPILGLGLGAGLVSAQLSPLMGVLPGLPALPLEVRFCAVEWCPSGLAPAPLTIGSHACLQGLRGMSQQMLFVVPCPSDLVKGLSACVLCVAQAYGFHGDGSNSDGEKSRQQLTRDKNREAQRRYRERQRVRQAAWQCLLGTAWGWGFSGDGSFTPAVLGSRWRVRPAEAGGHVRAPLPRRVRC